MSLILDGSNGITFPNSSTQAVGFYGFKNRIINGAMVIDQRNAGASVTPTTDSQYTLDRWQVQISQSSKFSVQQNAGSVTLPVGFTNYLGATSLSSYSVLTGDYFELVQPIEGFNCSDLAWGTANAQTVTLSFRVYSSLTGTFGGSIQNSAQNRSYPFSYTVSSANTWTTISVTVAGDTTGTWLTNNGRGIYVKFSLGAGATYSGTAGAWSSSLYLSATGATSVVGTNGATFYITGVQLEAGSTATSFDYRPYGTELALCQRYYYRTIPVATCDSAVGFVLTSTTANVYTQLPVQMRTYPTALEQSGTASDYSVRNLNTFTVCTAVPTISGYTQNIVATNLTTTGLTAGQGCALRMVNTNAYLGWSAEL